METHHCHTGAVTGVALPVMLSVIFSRPSFDWDTVHPVPEEKCHSARKPCHEKNLGTRDLNYHVHEVMWHDKKMQSKQSIISKSC